jgi:hypothetical protein
MRFAVAALFFAFGCVAPLQLAAGASTAHEGARPALEATARAHGTIAIDRPRHEALWLGAAFAVSATPNTLRGFLGPELFGSRLRDPRSEARTLDALWLRPEVGGQFTESSGNFFGGSVGAVHEINRMPFTIALRGGSVAGGSDPGFYGSLTVGVILSSSLYWMQ